MWRRILRIFACFLIAGTCCLPSAHAQRGRYFEPEQENTGSRTAALPYTVAFLSLLIVMVILCMPTRKPER